MKKIVILFLTFQINLGFTQMNQSTNIISKAPKASKISYKHKEHGVERDDPYHWLRDDDRKNQNVIDYLNQENEYTDIQLKNQQPLIDKLYHEIIERLPSKEQTVPALIDDYWYYSRYAQGNEYPIYARKKENLEANEEIMVDMNVRAKDKSYFQSNYQAISPNHKILGFSEDVTGRRKYSLYFKNLETGEMYDDVITKTTGTIVLDIRQQNFFSIQKNTHQLCCHFKYTGMSWDLKLKMFWFMRKKIIPFTQVSVLVCQKNIS